MTTPHQADDTSTPAEVINSFALCMRVLSHPLAHLIDRIDSLDSADTVILELAHVCADIVIHYGVCASTPPSDPEAK